jgi:hypothetical protein
MKFRIVFWDVLPCKMIVDRRFRGAYCLHHQTSEVDAMIVGGCSFDNVFYVGIT